MDHFHYIKDELYCEQVPLKKIAHDVGTPCYVYSAATLTRHFHAFDKALANHPHLICYAVKANSNLAILQLLAKLGAGFDVVSQGELARVLTAGGDPASVVFSGVGKTQDEICYALSKQIHCINVESVPEFELIAAIAKSSQQVAPISLRVNPDIDAQTHPYISTGLKENKFGIAVEEAMALYLRAAQDPNLKIVGIDCHIGSQLTTLTPFLDALARLLVMVDELQKQGIELAHIDIGGGLGVRYHDETPPHPTEYAEQILAKLKPRTLTLLMEPGRAISANAGVLLTTILFKKQTEHKNFLLVDAGMNDCLRPALYQAWHEIIPLKKHSDVKTMKYDVVGPVCETGDFLGKDRELAVQAGEVLALRGMGAYGFAMSSQYNSRPRAAEVLVMGDRFHVIRVRESIDDLYRHEQLLPAESS